MTDSTLKEYRCACGKLLFKAGLGTGSVEIKCRRCASISVFKLQSAAETVESPEAHAKKEIRKHISSSVNARELSAA